jgi:hypothetical protein
MNATTTLTLNDYANEREDVVLFWTSIGTPMGDYTPLGYPDIDFADRRGLLGLGGTIDDDGDWLWDGEGNPTDDRSNTIMRLHAYIDAKKWRSLVEEYESEY